MPYEKLDISTPKPVLSWANHALGGQETQMAKNVALLPFVFKHVALMPDVHLGKGALVGSVVATKDAIVPAAIGVDIGCFVGDTLIPLVDGKSYKISDLANLGEEFTVYACNLSSKIVAAKATAKLTRRNASLVKVTLDNGEAVFCTPEHKFMLRNGTYEEAQNLKTETSLMPFYSKLDRDGYTLIAQPYSGRWHKDWIVARSGLLGIPSFTGQRTVIHHKNFEASDNRPENLEFMGDREHSAYHRSLVGPNQYFQSPEFEQKRLGAIAKKAQTPEEYKYYAERGTINILRYMQQPEHFKQAVANNGKRGKQYLIAYNQSEKGRAKTKEIANRYYLCNICNAEIKDPIGLHNHKKYEHKCNHKVVQVETLNYQEDVYCLTVPEYHNFALKAGIFVHNCGMGAIKTPFTAEQLKGKFKKIRLDIEAAIPVGFNQNKDVEKSVTNWQGWADFKNLHSGVQHLESKAMNQMGSLGGGNHFLEVCLDSEDRVWLMLHSGSRNIGNMLAQNHISTAKELVKLADTRLPDPDLAYFIAGTPEFAAYWHDLQWAQNYARFNRDVMMARFKRIVEKHLAGGKPTKPLLSVNCHHNYAEKEVHFGESVYVTRKGAVRAREEDYGIIPGSMGAKSFIVKGLGNADSYCSCFATGTQVLTEFGLMTIEDIYNSSESIKLISYNQEFKKFEAKSILDRSKRIALTNKYSFSQTRRRLENTISCTPNHPFATYEKGVLTYHSIEEIALSSSAAIVPTHVGVGSNLTVEEQDTNFYYLLGTILSDGTIFLKERKSASHINNRVRNGKYLNSYLRIYQSTAPCKQPFMQYVENLFKLYTTKFSVRTQKPRIANLRGRSISGLGLIELTVSDLLVVEKVKKLIPDLPNILMGNPLLALYFLAGYLDGDGTHNKGIISISIGKNKMFSILVCTVLSLGIAYRVYPNRTNYVIEFRDNIILSKLSSICKRIVIDEPPERIYSDKLVLANSIVGGELKCDNLNTKAKLGKMVDIANFKEQSIDLSLTMNRVFKIESDLE